MLKKLSIAVSTLVTTLAVVQPAQASNLINGGFNTIHDAPENAEFGRSSEDPDRVFSQGLWAFMDESLVPGWETLASDNYIEVWSPEFAASQNVENDPNVDLEGDIIDRFIELNANQVSSVFQDVSGIAADLEVGFEFSHRARKFGSTVPDAEQIDTMRLVITDLGLDNVLGGDDDTILFSKQYSAGIFEWERNTNEGEAPIITLGNTMRFSYESVSTTAGNLTYGNFIDNASFGVGVGAVNSSADVPEPATVLGLLAFGTLGATSLKRNKK